MKSDVNVSIIIPLYNEEENIDKLYDELIKSLTLLDITIEIIFIDDGSRDGTSEKIRKIAEKDKRVKGIFFKNNSGQTAAISAGIDYSSGKILIPMDGDLQNDPYDIQRLLSKINEGFDVVSGWRRERKDNFLTRIIPSIIANSLISLISGVHLHDYGCSMKAYRREVIKDIKLYGEMHRFIPIYAHWHGAKVAEIPVKHHSRYKGKSKYGIERTVKVILDLIVVKYLGDYAQKPIYIFGGLGVLSILGSFLAGLYALYLKLFYHTSLIQTPLPLLSVLLFILGFNAILMGLLAEITIRTYYESQNKTTYLIKDTVNFPD